MNFRELVEQVVEAGLQSFNRTKDDVDPEKWLESKGFKHKDGEEDEDHYDHPKKGRVTIDQEGEFDYKGKHYRDFAKLQDAIGS